MLDMRRIVYGLLLVLALIVLYFLFWPVPIDPVGWVPPTMPVADGVYAENDWLAATEIVAPGHVGGESVAFDAAGRLYTGLADGRILRMDATGNEVEVFAEAVEPGGMDFTADGNLIVADATQGLLSIDVQGTTTVLVPAGDDEPWFYLNDLAIAADGKIYFSQSSTKFGKMDFVQETAEHGAYGSLWVYDPATDSTEKLVEGLYFANGVALSPDEDYVLVSENNAYRVSRYWLDGSNAGTVDRFVENLPGYPDNITFNGVDTFWLALGGGPESRATMDGLHPYPFVTKMILRIPESLRPAPVPQGYIVGLDLDGNVIYNLQDLSGAVFAPTTSVIEQDGMLYLGSLSMSGIGRIPVPAERLSQ